MFPKPHTVTVYRRGVTGSTEFREQKTGWLEVATGVQGDLQPAGGQVFQEEYGEAPERRRRGFFDAGTDIKPGDGLAVTAGPGTGTRWIVDTADDWGAPGALEIECTETAEAFT